MSALNLTPAERAGVAAGAYFGLVVAAFVLVAWDIAQGKDWLWLVVDMVVLSITLALFTAKVEEFGESVKR